MFFETSAKNAQNVDMSFQAIARQIMEKTASAPAKSNDFTKLDTKKKISGGVNQNTSTGSCC